MAAEGNTEFKEKLKSSSRN